MLYSELLQQNKNVSEKDIIAICNNIVNTGIKKFRNKYLPTLKLKKGGHTASIRNNIYNLVNEYLKLQK